MAGIVVSVEYIELTFSSTTGLQTVQQNLSKGQDPDNTVVWEARAYDNGTDGSNLFNNRMFDAWVDSNAGTARLNGERFPSSTGGAAVLRCFVVEFDSAAVTVQKGTWSFGVGSVTATAAISAVTTTSAFIKAFGRCVAASDDDFNGHIFRYEFNSTTELGFTRVASAGAGDPAGHWQVIEDTTGEFTVEHVSSSAGSTTEEVAVTITAISALADAFIIFSNDNAETADDVRDACWNAWMSSTTNVNIHRANGGAAAAGTDEFNLQIVEAQDGAFTVQRVSDTTQTTAGDESEAISTVADVDFTTVHLNLAISHSTAEANTTTGSNNWPYMLGAELASSSTIEVFSGSTGTKRYSAEIVEWVEVTASGNVNINAPAGAITLTGYDPLVLRDHTAAPNFDTITFTAYDPIIDIFAPGADVTVTPPSATITLGTFDPAVAITGADVTTTPNAGTIALTGYSPTITRDYSKFPNAGTVTLTPYDPTVVLDIAISIAAPKATITLNAFDPTVAIAGNIQPNTGTITLNPYAPSILRDHTAAVGPRSITLTGYDPEIVFKGWQPTTDPSGTWTPATESSDIWTPVTESTDTWT